MIIAMDVEALQKMIERYDEIDDGGGPLHIVLADCNVRDSDLEQCHISACVEGNDLARLIVAAMYRRSPDERRRLMGWDDYYAVDEDGNHLWS
jgi:hypothetical protein